MAQLGLSVILQVKLSVIVPPLVSQYCYRLVLDEYAKESKVFWDSCDYMFLSNAPAFMIFFLVELDPALTEYARHIGMN